MKKIISILFLFLLCFLCYFIYIKTEDRTIDIVAIGDDIANNPYLKDYSFNHDFTNKDYHITDLLNIIKYNQEKAINNTTESIHQLLKKADILIISIGINDIYYKLGNNTHEIYTYLNDIINDYNLLLTEISRYDYQEVYILNYYNTTNNNQDLFTYINYKLEKLASAYHYHYLDIAKNINNNPQFYLKNGKYMLNNEGYYQIYKLFVENFKKS